MRQFWLMIRLYLYLMTGDGPRKQATLQGFTMI